LPTALGKWFFQVTSVGRAEEATVSNGRRTAGRTEETADAAQDNTKWGKQINLWSSGKRKKRSHKQ